MYKQIAEEIVVRIKEDFTDRRGLRQEWEQIDKDTQDAICESWVKIVNAVLQSRIKQ